MFCHRLPVPNGFPEHRKPLKDTDTIRVYHGFNDIGDIFQTLKTGLSGQERANRIYSYEFNNNPKGLFVTIALSVAKQFGQYIIEFHTPVKDLEAPVWPNGSYTVQGQMAASFNEPEDRENARMDARKKSSESKYPSIQQSDRPELAELLYQTSEQQALFIGNLNRNSVRAIWVNPTPEKCGTYCTFKRMSVKEFLKEHNVDPNSRPQKYGWRLYEPRETFEINDFIDRLTNRSGRGRKAATNGMSREDIIDSFKYLTKENLLTYVWPNQLEDAWKAISEFNK